MKSKTKRELNLKNSGIKELFQFKNYILMLFANSISRFGDSLDTIAYAWMVYNLTGSKLLMGFLYALNAVPNIIVSPFSGVFIDRLSKKKVIIICNLGRGLMVSTTALLYFFGLLRPYHLFILTILNSTLESFITPASASFFTMVLPKEHYLAGNSFSASLASFSELLGYAVAGFTISFLGISGAILIDGMTFLLACVIILKIKLTEDLTNKSKLTVNNYFKDLKEGFSFIKRNTTILITIILVSITNFGLAPMNSFQTVFVKDILQEGPGLMSYLGIAVMVGIIIGGIIVGQIGSRFKISTMVIFGFILFGITYSMLYIPGNIEVIIPGSILSIILYFLCGLCIPIMTSPIKAFLFSNTPKDILGRVISVLAMTSMCAVPLGSAITGVIIEYISLSTLFLIMGSLISIIALSLIFNKEFLKI